MGRLLKKHQDSACDAVRRLEVDASRPAVGELALRYVLSGEATQLWLPSAATPVRADELWRRTCFEAFAAPLGQGGYVEINLAPTAQWAAYGFTGYRDGMRSLGDVPAPRLDSLRSAGSYEFRASFDLGASGLPVDAPWQVALSAVIEDASGAKSYWALAHPAGKPDFHHPESFVLELPAP
jgi:hypothetical protein